jgi:hypothetical protein
MFGQKIGQNMNIEAHVLEEREPTTSDVMSESRDALGHLNQ